MTATPSLSLVIPIYNEAATLESFWGSVEEQCNALGIEWQVTWIDDRSSDATPQMLQRLAEGGAGRHRVILREQNMGIAFAWRDCFKLAGGVVGLIPSDGQFQPSQLRAVMAAFDGGTDAAVVMRRLRADHWSRRVISAFSRWSERLLMGNRYPDIHWVHFWRGGLLDGIEWHGETTAIDAEWSFHVRRRIASPGRVKLLDLPHSPRAGGKATGGKANTTILRLSMRTLIDLIRVAFLVRILRRWDNHQAD